MTPETRYIFAHARGLLANPHRWTQNTFARDDDGNRVQPLNPTASCWCIIGALTLASQGNSTSFVDIPAEVWAVLRSLLPADVDADQFNDDPDTTHADVRSFLDRALAA